MASEILKRWNDRENTYYADKPIPISIEPSIFIPPAWSRFTISVDAKGKVTGLHLPWMSDRESAALVPKAQAWEFVPQKTSTGPEPGEVELRVLD